ncbi:sarcosine oxidase subunit gamma [Halomonas halmophila]|uniref:Sarcosine oxidase subunit gamma n=1 Tax=Halomonas halmophila TaxID=252 RepID=A0A4Y4EW71_9GAMM|nr:sarcosine oxidase subunit gamma family protein [Halomonas halmophila]GED21383.1 sarcosine oxidase subunit gamma [Halomonas halmophila]
MSNTVDDKIKTFDTRTDANVPIESPLAYTYRRSGAPAPDKNSKAVLHERPFLGHLTLRGGAIVLDEALRSVLDMSLPAEPQSLLFDASGERSVQWISPDEWLLIVPGGEEFELENRLREALGDAHFAITNVGGGQTVVDLEGEAASELLMKSVIYDVHPQHFPVGKGVTTVFAKASVILRRPSETRWELVVRRSFADYVYRWLLDAGAEYGIGVQR